MTFGEKVKELRLLKRLSQREVAEKLGISTRAYQSYEQAGVIPKKRDVLVGLSELYRVSIDHLLDGKELFYMEVADRYGARGSQQAKKILDDTQSYLAGGDLSDEEREDFMASLMRMYLRSKEIAKVKYGKKDKSDESAQ
jgi:transcriptional regulator with XRE-family HTH domain